MRAGIFGLGSVFLGAIVAGVSTVIVMGSILLAFTEENRTSAVASYPTLESIAIYTPEVEKTATPTPTFTTTASPTSTPTFTATISPTTTTTPIQTTETEAAACETPPGWIVYTIQPNDTLNKIAADANIAPQDLADANCLVESRLVPGSTLYLPPPYPTTTPVRCGAPSNWVIYIVQPGDTLYNIALRTNSTVSQLKYANCLTSDTIRNGQKLHVPFQPAPLASPTVPIATVLPSTATSTPTPTATPTDSNISKETPPYPYPSP